MRKPKRIRNPYPPVQNLSVEQLHHRLVTEHVAGKLPPLQWVVDATHRIAEERNIDVDEAYREWHDEVVSLRPSAAVWGGAAG